MYVLYALCVCALLSTAIPEMGFPLDFRVKQTN